MTFLGIGKKKVLDLTTGRYKGESSSLKFGQTKEDPAKKPETQESSGGMFGFFGSTASSGSSSSAEKHESIGQDEKKRRLAKRLLDITTRLEDLSNQIYHLQQRVEVLERKSGVGF